MKKFMKFLCGAASMAAVAFGAYCVYKNVVAKKDEDDFDDFDDCFDEEASDDTEENREYVSINITEEASEEENTEEEASEVADDARLTEAEYDELFAEPKEEE